MISNKKKLITIENSCMKYVSSGEYWYIALAIFLLFEPDKIASKMFV